MTDHQAKLTGIRSARPMGQDYAVYAYGFTKGLKWERLTSAFNFSVALSYSAVHLKHYTGMPEIDIIVVDMLTRRVVVMNGIALDNPHDVSNDFPFDHFERHLVTIEMMKFYETYEP